MPRRLHLLARSAYFSELDRPILERLALSARRVIAPRGELIARAQTPQSEVCYLVQGTLALYRKNMKRKTALLLGLVQGPAIIGDAECAMGGRWIVSIRAQDDVECLMLPNEPFLDAVRSNVEVCFRLYQDACVRHLLANYTAQATGLHDVEARLVRLLLDYVRCYGRPAGDAVLIERHATITAIAGALGLNRRTIERALGPLEARGLVTRLPDSGTIRVEDLPGLRAHLPPDVLGLVGAPA